ncbi:MAG: addiction module protein [Candidatus Hydrogenedentes bacterium]|nr:addiction module protein [Candidatus Hydrogenedentota bacterium]
MDVVIPLDKMSVAEKLRAMEESWDDLQRGSGEVPSPAWHEDILRARENRVNEGVSNYADWSEAKDRIPRQTQ